ncbi:hypothetical protein [Streptomyces sp. NPDC001621]|uniref:hypothetical protein n=1 Tax=Streptomyces sp. NPDC001621 TaxID=3364594 RepID=UPI0036A349EE
MVHVVAGQALGTQGPVGSVWLRAGLLCQGQPSSRLNAASTPPLPAATTNAVHLRAGRGTGHRSLAVLAKNTDFYAECWGVTAADVWWAYGVVESGPRNGRRGWVAGDHLATGYKHP